MIYLMHLKHPNPAPSSLWENCPPQNWSLVPKWLGTTALVDFVFGEDLAETCSLSCSPQALSWALSLGLLLPRSELTGHP